MPRPKSAKSDKQWNSALLLAAQRIEEDQVDRNINRMATALVNKALEGDVSALKEVGDRLDGKPAQTLKGDSESPLTIETIRRVIVRDNA